MFMYFSLMKARLHVYYETRFRLPSQPERDMALWVDRIGSEPSGRLMPEQLRILGQFAAISVESGRGEFFSPAAERLELLPGDVVLLFPNEPNRYGANPVWQTRWVVWNGPEAQIMAQHAGFSPHHPVIHNAMTAVRRAFDGLQPLMQTESFMAVLERKRLMLGLMAELLQHQQAGAGADEHANRIATLVAQLSDPAATEPTIAEMAQACHLSASQFRRLFRRHTGRSPVEFLTARRMTQAKTLLAQGVPMKDVAIQTGYADVFYFMRVFHKTVGQTVRQFQTSGIALRA